MPIIDIIERPSAPLPFTAEDEAWMAQNPGLTPLRFLDNESTRRMDRIILAAKTSLRTGGVLPEAKGYKLPPMITELEAVQMGHAALGNLMAAATWTYASNADAIINLDHPDVKAVL